MKTQRAQAAGRHQISDQLDDARRISRISAAEGRHAQRRLVRRRDHRAHPRAWRRRRRSRRPSSSTRMRALVRDAMKEGALGVGSSLIYAPANYAETPELIAITERGRQMRRHVHQPHAQRGPRAARGDRRADRDFAASPARPPKSITSSRPARPIGTSSTRRSPRSKRRAPRACGSPPTCTPIRPARPASTPPCRVGPGRRARGMDRAPEGPRDPRQGHRRDAQPGRGMGEPAPARRRRRTRCCWSASRTRS